MRIFDSHTHLNDTAFAGREAECLQRAAALDVTRIAVVGSNTLLNQGAIDLAQRFNEVYAIVGWHPEDSKDFNDEKQVELLTQLAQPKVVALGEIGLDYHWNTSPQFQQRRVFEQQLDLAEQLQLPVSIHTRDALADTYEILRHHQNVHGILHSFNAAPEWAEKFLKLGYFLSYSGVVSFKNAPLVHASAKITPFDRLLVETDAPYLTPVPHRGQQNETGYTRFVVEALAKLRPESVAEIAEQTYQNAESVFNLS